MDRIFSIRCVILAFGLLVRAWGDVATLRKIGPDPTEATEKRHSFELEHKRVRIACVGDSITWGLKAVPFGLPSYPFLLQEHLGNASYEVLNFGHCTKCLINNGDDPFVNTDEYKWSIASDPDMVIIMLGTNDARNSNYEKATTDYVPDYVKLIKTFQSLDSKPKVFIATPPPIVHGEFTPGWNMTFQNVLLPTLVQNAAAKAKVEDPIDVYGAFMGHCPKGFWSACDWISDDGVHPSPEGYVGIAAAMQARVKSAAASQLASLRGRATGTLQQKIRKSRKGPHQSSLRSGQQQDPNQKALGNHSTGDLEKELERRKPETMTGNGSWWHFW